MRELKNILDRFSKATQPMALATIVGTTGSSYRRAGARLLVLADGETVGTLSGGCIEEEVAQRGLEVLHDGRANLFTIDTLKRFGCPGSLEILLERIEPANPFLTFVSQCLQDRKIAEVVVSLEEPMGSVAQKVLTSSRESFCQIILPPIRLLVVGEGSDTEALLQYSRILGWDCVVLEASQVRGLEVDRRTALVIKNHHFGRDLAALSEGLLHAFGYVGLLSSLKRKRQLIGMLDFEKFAGKEDLLENFHGPSGLDLGSDTPEEIALSIVAEIQAVMTGHTAGFLRDYAEPIHQARCLVAA